MTRFLRFCFGVPESVPHFKHRLKILDNAYSCLQWGICARRLLYFIYAMYNELSAALLLVHYAKSSLIKDRIPSRAQRTILPPHCYPFLFDGNLRSGVIYLFIFFCFFPSLAREKMVQKLRSEPL